MFTEGLMQSLDVLLSVLAIAAIIGFGLYFGSGKKEPIETIESKPADTPREDFDFETAKELLPYFPEEPEPEQESELSWKYNDDKITIMARDPETVYSYWDISEEKHYSLENTYGTKWHEAKPVLRVHDITEAEQSQPIHWDIDVDESMGNWYVNFVNPGRTYFVELGRILDDDHFVVVARSNPTKTPPNGISDKIDPNWLLVSEKERKLFGRINYKGSSSLDLFKI